MLESSKPLVSVVTPVYNSEKYLKTCIDSILLQSLSNLELILVDDGSTDDSGNICDYYAMADSRVKVIHRENSGVSAARNAALELVSGKFLAFVDSDDYIEKNCFENLIPKFNDSSVDAVFFGWFEEKNTVRKFPISKNDKKVSNTEAVKNINNFNGTGYCGYLCNKIYRIKKNINRFCTDTYVCEDYIWNLGMLKRCNNVMLVTEPYYHYIQRYSSASRFSSERMSEIESREKILTITEQNWPELKDQVEIKTMYSFIKMEKRLYFRKDKKNLQILKPYLKKFRRKFYFGPLDIVPFKIKLKAFGLETLTHLRVNASFLKGLDGLLFGKAK